MDFQYDKQDTRTSDYSYDVFEDEDDLLFVELRRQVLQLTADEDDDEGEDRLHENKHSTTVETRKSSPKNSLYGVTQSGSYYNWVVSKEDFVAPAWMLKLWRKENNGTGVFIPQVSQTRRKNKPSMSYFSVLLI
ncbi:hypothetical protein F511_44918 [Dorcoceras hygrometricum]|uniref:Uncharacterized protein n=1 Tax=Dorcoceras hygrometricum TaxID=472368 RepID=A0A2Z6ZX89_9LAMI|nr:hypothetical protein F511_44918 [Dorcoceras hygrometricum]